MNQTVDILGMDFTASIPDSFKGSDAGGIYIFARLTPDLKAPTALFVGQCESFRIAVPPHPLWPEAAGLGATHVLTLEVPVPTTCALIAQNMITLLRPPLNTPAGGHSDQT